MHTAAQKKTTALRLAQPVQQDRQKTTLNITRCLGRADMSVVPPKFRKTSALCTMRECHSWLPIPLPLITVGISVGVYWEHFKSLFNPKLKGYFHTPFTKVFTSHFLSVHQECMYSSSSMLFVRNCLYAL